MLPDQWRIQGYNGIGGTVDANSVVVTFRGWYRNSTGVIVYGSETTVLNQTGAWSSVAYENGTTQDNGAETNPFEGGYLAFDCDLGSNTATANGSLIFRLQTSNDDGTTFEDDGKGIIVAQVYWDNANSDQDDGAEI